MFRKLIYREIQYIAKPGFSPIEEFIDGLDIKTQAKVLDVFDQIETQKKPSAKIYKKLKGTDGIWEIRIFFNKNKYQFLCFRYEGKLVILTNAFLKKTDKTPKKEIKLAEQRKTEFLNDEVV